MRKTSLALIWVCLLGLLPPACGSTSPSDTLITQDLVVGTGATVLNGDTVTVTYVGTFVTNGTQFDAGKITFRVGAGAVIKGWDQGVVGMQVGGKRRLTVPPSLAYGAAGNSTIPPNSTLQFEIVLLAIAGK
jgi:FKBP-type peptidyl-prolyl cis-trans isomerase